MTKPTPALLSLPLLLLAACGSTPPEPVLEQGPLPARVVKPLGDDEPCWVFAERNGELLQIDLVLPYAPDERPTRAGTTRPMPSVDSQSVACTQGGEALRIRMRPKGGLVGTEMAGGGQAHAVYHFELREGSTAPIDCRIRYRDKRCRLRFRLE